jgi:uncharacterized protein YhaN
MTGQRGHRPAPPGSTESIVDTKIRELNGMLGDTKAAIRELKNAKAEAGKAHAELSELVNQVNGELDLALHHLDRTVAETIDKHLMRRLEAVNAQIIRESEQVRAELSRTFKNIDNTIAQWTEVKDAETLVRQISDRIYGGVLQALAERKKQQQNQPNIFAINATDLEVGSWLSAPKDETPNVPPAYSNNNRKPRRRH